MSTYSTGTPPTDANKLTDFQSVLNILPDNTSKLISPKDVRDASFTLWENIIFKPTNAGGDEYIGIDQDFITNKILFGKKKVGGQFVMNNSLLSTDVDIFFYNTKQEPTSNYDTKVAFLAGTSSNVVLGQVSAPYLRSKVVTNGTYSKTLDFDIINPSYYTLGGSNLGGNVNILSENGNVYLNGIKWPTLDVNNTGISYQDYVLKYKWISGEPNAVWEEASTASVDSLFSTGTVTIDGSPVILNGLPIDFSDSTPTPVDIGGIPAGSTFSNEPVTEMIRRILYPYIKPRLSTSLDYSLIEAGDTKTNFLNYEVIRNATYSINSFLVSGSVILPTTGFSVNPLTILNGISTGQIQTSPNPTSVLGSTTIAYETFTFSTTIQDTFITSVTATSSVKFVIPWYYGTSQLSFTDFNINNILGSSSTPTLGYLTPILSEPATSTASVHNKSVSLSTLNVVNVNQGYVYFGYPSVFPDLSLIVDQNGFDVTGSFKKFEISGVNSPNGYWANKNYKFYIYVGPSGSNPLLTTINTSPPYDGVYQFKFS